MDGFNGTVLEDSGDSSAIQLQFVGDSLDGSTLVVEGSDSGIAVLFLDFGGCIPTRVSGKSDFFPVALSRGVEANEVLFFGCDGEETDDGFVSVFVATLSLSGDNGAPKIGFGHRSFESVIELNKFFPGSIVTQYRADGGVDEETEVVSGFFSNRPVTEQTKLDKLSQAKEGRYAKVPHDVDFSI